MNETGENLALALENETKKFEECYLWFKKAFSVHFFNEISEENLILTTHNLMAFDLQNYFCTIHLKKLAIVMCLDSPDADLRILENFQEFGIKNYITFVSSIPPPFMGIEANMRIGFIYFTDMPGFEEHHHPPESVDVLKKELKARNPQITESAIEHLIAGFNPSFLKTLSHERLILALDMYFRATTRDRCQYEVRTQEDWKETGKPSLQIVLAWKNTPKYNFLYRLAHTIYRNGLVMKGVNATYINPYSKESILVMSLALHGANGQAAWDAADIPEFLREFATVKYFATFDIFEKRLISKGLITGTMGNFFRAMNDFVHQTLVHVDMNLYTHEHVEEALVSHPELSERIGHLVELKFHPKKHDFEQYLEEREALLSDIIRLDTGNEEVDNRRKNVLIQSVNMIHFCLKTNLFRKNYTALSFRMDPKYLDEIPFDRTEKFPVLPYAIFFIKGMHYFGFHIRFRNLSRGGLRTVYLKKPERMITERNQIFTECYNLALTQQKKNKDIPEGGAKGIIFLKPYERLINEIDILRKELAASGIEPSKQREEVERFEEEQKLEYLHQTQRSFVETLIMLVNCDPDGTLRVKDVVDYWKKPEYLYLGPDENMHDQMIDWIASLSKKYDYKPGSSFISGKPKTGINHKEYGVTSHGVNVYCEALLKYQGIDPEKEPFTVKISGGPDGDVAGNEILNLHKYYPKTAKLIALTDVSGTIYDPEGLDLKLLSTFFKENKPIRHYPPEKLHDDGFLLDKDSRRQETALSFQTLLWRKEDGKTVEEWLSGSEMNTLYKNNLNSIHADIFIPAGGRPRTLNENNVDEFLDETGKPTSFLVVEGANLYMTQKARDELEILGVLIIKDSSANKTGVICSSFEVLSGLTLGDEKFVENKPTLVKEILERLSSCAEAEANLMLKTHKETGIPLTVISDKISERINLFNDQISEYLEPITLPDDPDDPLIRAFLDYCLPTLRDKFQKELLQNIPSSHKKAVIACHLSASLVYKKGLDWFPSIVDILPLILREAG
ncbi:MAG: NAD-glutamate dehydrogenase [Chlamydiia bacterium]|nr:NAD-glutamate dehydrogenase [Chlamydiia bacterium]